MPLASLLISAAQTAGQSLVRRAFRKEDEDDDEVSQSELQVEIDREADNRSRITTSDDLVTGETTERRVPVSLRVDSSLRRELNQNLEPGIIEPPSGIPSATISQGRIPARTFLAEEAFFDDEGNETFQSKINRFGGSLASIGDAILEDFKKPFTEGRIQEAVAGAGFGFSKAADPLVFALEQITGRDAATTEELFKGIDVDQDFAKATEAIGNVALFASLAKAITVPIQAATSIPAVSAFVQRFPTAFSVVKNALIFGGATTTLGQAREFEEGESRLLSGAKDFVQGALLGVAFLPNSITIGVPAVFSTQFLISKQDGRTDEESALDALIMSAFKFGGNVFQSAGKFAQSERVNLRKDIKGLADITRPITHKTVKIPREDIRVVQVGEIGVKQNPLAVEWVKHSTSKQRAAVLKGQRAAKIRVPRLKPEELKRVSEAFTENMKQKAETFKGNAKETIERNLDLIADQKGFIRIPGFEKPVPPGGELVPGEPTEAQELAASKRLEERFGSLDAQELKDLTKKAEDAFEEKLDSFVDLEGAIELIEQQAKKPSLPPSEVPEGARTRTEEIARQLAKSLSKFKRFGANIISGRAQNFSDFVEQTDAPSIVNLINQRLQSAEVKTKGPSKGLQEFERVFKTLEEGQVNGETFDTDEAFQFFKQELRTPTGEKVALATTKAARNTQIAKNPPVKKEKQVEIRPDIKDVLGPVPSGVPPSQTTSPILSQDLPQIDLPKETKWEAVRRYIEDSNIRLKKLNELIIEETGEEVPDYLDLWAKKDMLPRVVSRKVEKIEEEKLKFMQELNTADIELSDLDTYMRALHGPERNAKMKEVAVEEGRVPEDGLSGMTDIEAQQIIKNAEDSGQKEELDRFAKDLKKVSDRTLDMLEKNGMIKPKEKKLIQAAYKNYVPLQRDIEDKFFGPGTGSGIDIKGKEIKRARGSKKEVLSPTAQIFRNLQKAEVRIIKNDVGKTILSLVEAFPFMKTQFQIESQKTIPVFNNKGEIQEFDPKFKLGDDVVSVKVDGKQKFITVKDERVAWALRNTKIAELRGVSKGVRVFTSLWSQLATKFNPEFIVTNFQRDLTEALINVKAEKVDQKGLVSAVAKNTIPSQRRIWRDIRGQKKDKVFQEFLDVGGDVGNFWVNNAKEAQTSLEKLEKQISNQGIEKIKNPIRIIGKTLEDVNSMVELGVRFSAYEELIKRGMSKQKAVQAAADLTVNFSRQGEMSPVLKAWWAFINPAIQGGSKVIRTQLKSKRARRAAAGLAFLGFMVRFIQDQIGEDNIPDWIRNRQIAFEFPEEIPGIGGKQLTLWNIGYGYTPFYSFGANAYDLMAGKKTNEEAVLNVIQTTYSSFSPVESSAAGVAPTIVRPIYEIATNKNFMGFEIHPQYSNLGLTPPPQSGQTSKGTTKAAQLLAEMIFKASDGLVDVFPDDLDHLWDQYTSGAGRFVSNSIDTGAKLVSGEEIADNRIPFFRKFVRESKVSSAVNNEIFDTLDVAAKRNLNDARKERFLAAVDKGLDNDVFGEKRAKDFVTAFFKGQEDIKTFNFSDNPGVVDSFLKFNELPEEDQETISRFLGEDDIEGMDAWNLALEKGSQATAAELQDALGKDSIDADDRQRYEYKVVSIEQAEEGSSIAQFVKDAFDDGLLEAAEKENNMTRNQAIFFKTWENTIRNDGLLYSKDIEEIAELYEIDADQLKEASKKNDAEFQKFILTIE